MYACVIVCLYVCINVCMFVCRYCTSCTYGWPPLCTPTLCVHGTPFLWIMYSSFLMGGLPSLHHNEIRDLTATLLTEVRSCALNQSCSLSIILMSFISPPRILKMEIVWILPWTFKKHENVKPQIPI